MPKPRRLAHVLCQARARRLAEAFASDTADMAMSRTHTLQDYSDRPWLLDPADRATKLIRIDR
jgi:hypothetical protein